jgi:hypothetical protein
MKLLIGAIGGGVDRQLLLQAALGVLQTRASPARDRVGLAFAMRLQLMSGLALPAAPTFAPALQLLEVKLNPRIKLGRLAASQLLFALGLQARLGRGQRLAALVTRAQPGRRLIATIIAMAIVFELVDLLSIGQELFDDRDIGPASVA